MFSVIVPLAAVASLACVIIVTSFVAIFTLRHVIRSMDIFVSSILLTLLGNASVVVLMPSLIYLASSFDTWGDTLTCKMYLWVVTALRINSMVSLVAISLERVLLIRRPGKYHYRATLAVCLGVGVTWVVAMVLALVPVLGWSHFKYRVSGETGDGSYVLHGYCTLFLHELHHGLGIGVMVLEFACMFISVICVSDIYCHLRYLTKRTLFSSNSRDAVAVARNCYADMNVGHSPTHRAKIGHTNPAFKSMSSINRSNNFIGNDLLETAVSSSSDVTADLPMALGTVQGSVQFAAALDSCKIVIVLLAVMIILDHLPYTVLTTYGIVDNFDTHIGQVVMMWLYSFESIFVGVSLWLFNIRYRKAHARIFTCWCRGSFFLKESEDVIADVHDAKYSAPPNYASHQTRYHDTSKTVHKSILNDISVTSQSQHCYTNDVMASTSTSSNGSAQNVNPSSRENVTSSQETLENTGDTQEIDLSSMIAAHKAHAQHLREQVGTRTSNSDAPSDDSDTNSYLSLKRFVNQSSEDIGTPLTRGNDVSTRTAREGRPSETGEDYEVLRVQNTSDTHGNKSLERANNNEPTDHTDKNSKPTVPNDTELRPCHITDPAGSTQQLDQEEKFEPGSKREAFHSTRAQDSVDSVDAGQTPVYTLEDIEEALDTEQTSNDGRIAEDNGAADAETGDSLRDNLENQNKNNSNESYSHFKLIHNAEDNQGSCIVENFPTSNSHVIAETSAFQDIYGSRSSTVAVDSDEEVDEFDQIFQYKPTGTAMSLADELRHAQTESELEDDDEEIRDNEIKMQSSGVKPIEIPDVHVVHHGDCVTPHPRLSTIYEHFGTNHEQMTSSAETRGRGKPLGTFPAGC